VRFYQGALLDEVARELMIFRKVLGDFLCHEGGGSTLEGGRALCDALRCVDLFVDELIAQSIVTFAACMRPPLKTRTSIWPPPRRRRTDFQGTDDRD
jgi:hypothetical protein